MKRLLLALVLVGLAVPARPDSPTVNSSNSGTSGSDTTTHSIVMPATVNAGELLVAILATDCATTCSITWDNSTLGTWSQLHEEMGTSHGLAVYAKVAAGTEDGGTLSVTGSNETDAWATLAIGTWEGTIAGGTNTTGAVESSVGCDPDPPAATDSWGSVDRYTLAIATQDGGDIAVSIYPGSYILNQLSNPSGSGPGTIVAHAGRAQTSAGSQNPGAYTMAGNCSNEEWATATLSVRGTSGAPPAAPSNLMLLGVGP